MYVSQISDSVSLPPSECTSVKEGYKNARKEAIIVVDKYFKMQVRRLIHRENRKSHLHFKILQSDVRFSLNVIY